jgi:HEAT repeat protein
MSLANELNNESKKAQKRTIHSYIVDLCKENGMVRKQARENLVRIGKTALPYLVRLTKDHQSFVRWEALKTLTEIADPTSAPVFIAALADENMGIRWLAAEGLIALNKEGLKEILKSLELQKLHVFLRQGAHHVLSEYLKHHSEPELTELITQLENPDIRLLIPLTAHKILVNMDDKR